MEKNNYKKGKRRSCPPLPNEVLVIISSFCKTLQQYHSACCVSRDWKICFSKKKKEAHEDIEILERSYHSVDYISEKLQLELGIILFSKFTWPQKLSILQQYKRAIRYLEDDLQHCYIQGYVSKDNCVETLRSPEFTIITKDINGKDITETGDYHRLSAKYVELLCYIMQDNHDKLLQLIKVEDISLIERVANSTQSDVRQHPHVLEWTLLHIATYFHANNCLELLLKNAESMELSHARNTTLLSLAADVQNEEAAKHVVYKLAKFKVGFTAQLAHCNFRFKSWTVINQILIIAGKRKLLSTKDDDDRRFLLGLLSNAIHEKQIATILVIHQVIRPKYKQQFYSLFKEALTKLQPEHVELFCSLFLEILDTLHLLKEKHQLDFEVSALLYIFIRSQSVIYANPYYAEEDLDFLENLANTDIRLDNTVKTQLLTLIARIRAARNHDDDPNW